MMPKATIGALVGVSILLAGCADGGVLAHYEKSGATAADFRLDAYNCDRDAGMLLDPTLAGGIMRSKCLQAHGWEIVRGPGENVAY